ncbi:putative UDP-glucuronate:xylan alpha-glucuronosyltransferase 4 [Bidens hawaiensis]|uniref:putative UDP-glucuronate:xylan alpha-glucuronosyltransferase 4 n=1 Tax=Bidens hawaiensis TaxID=980011 RepID=UPI0040490422
MESLHLYDFRDRSRSAGRQMNDLSKYMYEQAGNGFRFLKDNISRGVASMNKARRSAKVKKMDIAERDFKMYVRDEDPLSNMSQSTRHAYKSREAYVTVLHSSEKYFCGAIALAQSIRKTNSTKDLVLLADQSISPKSIQGLIDAGWKIKFIERIHSPHAKKDAYNEYNYSKLRIWQITEYDKVMFIDADLIVLRKLDEFFKYPQLSTVGNDKYMFNSGLFLIEPSQCMFSALMGNIFNFGSYNGGDQGFLNEAFTWWHRFHSKINYLKVFQDPDNPNREIPEKLCTIHYLGLKPWACYIDYDCNWDLLSRRHYASDSAHKKWWAVYDTMPRKLKSFCGLTKKMDARLQKWRGKAKKAGFRDQHWKINIKDRRQTLHMML